MIEKKLEKFSGILPIFPLPNIVLFPGMLITLHIFEESYNELIEFSLKNDRFIGVTLLKEDEYEICKDKKIPGIHNILCLSEIIAKEKYNENYNIALLGLKRARIKKIIQTIPYRMAEVSLIEDIIPLNHDQHEILKKFPNILGQLKELGISLEKIEKTNFLGVLSDLIVSSLDLTPDDKQNILEEFNVEKRIEKISKTLEEIDRNLYFVKMSQKLKPKDIYSN